MWAAFTGGGQEATYRYSSTRSATLVLSHDASQDEGQNFKVDGALGFFNLVKISAGTDIDFKWAPSQRSIMNEEDDASSVSVSFTLSDRCACHHHGRACFCAKSRILICRHTPDKSRSRVCASVCMHISNADSIPL